MTALASRRRARALWPLAAVASIVALVALMLGVAVVADTLGQRSETSARADGQAGAISGYGEALVPASKAAGKTILAGVRPDLAEFQAGRLAESVWVEDMESYAGEFALARALFAATPAPRAVDDAPARFDEAFGAYADAVAVLRLAAFATGPGRDELLALGAALGDEGDRLFDEGAARIQAARRRVGLKPDPRFPDRPGVVSPA
jgi:hypothetical protein